MSNEIEEVQMLVDNSNNSPDPKPLITHHSALIALVAGTRRQVPFPARPARLYSPSEFFTLALTLAQRTADRVFILSPRYGLLAPAGPAVRPYKIDPPDLWPPARRHAWADAVLRALLPHLRPGDTCAFYAGRAYRAEIQYRLTQLGYPCVAPLQGLDPEGQLARLRALVDETEPGAAAAAE